MYYLGVILYVYDCECVIVCVIVCVNVVVVVVGLEIENWVLCLVIFIVICESMESSFCGDC